MKKISVLFALLVVVGDRILKLLSNRSMLHGSFEFIHFAHLHNYGATMGILRGDRLLLITFATVALAVLVFIWFKAKSSSIWFWIGWALLTGGTVGNLLDRLIYGYVTDMLQIPGYPAIFNVADIGIRTGVILMLIGSWRLSDIRSVRRRHELERGVTTDVVNNKTSSQLNQ